MGYLVPIIMLLGLGIMAYFMVKNKKQQTDWIQNTATIHKWECKINREEGPGVYQISGKSSENIKWELNAYSRSNTEGRNVMIHSSREYTEWIARIIDNQYELLVIPRDPSWKNYSEEQILGFIKPTWKAMGIPSDRFSPVTAFNSELESSYFIFSTNLETTKTILQVNLTNLILKWRGMSRNSESLVNIRISPNEITLQVGYLINNPKEAELMIEIGETVGKNFGS